MTQKDPTDVTGALAGRRDFFRGTAMAGAALLAPCLPRTTTSGESLSYEDFLVEAVPLAKRLATHTERFGEDAYLFALAALAVRLRSVDEPEFRRINPAGQPAHWIGANDTPEGCPFTVLHWKLEPHGIVRPHPHTYGNVVTLGLEGEVRICNHETVEPADYAATASFLLRRTNDQVLRPHDVNLVPLQHGFIHGFVAGAEGARGLDITTRVRPKQPNFSVEIIAEPKDPARAVFEGRWVQGS